MACGCADKENDKIIMAEIERRKALEPSQMEIQDSEEFLEFYFPASIIEIVATIDEKRIIRIEKTNNGWAVFFNSEYH